jgi:hypothetical protein
MRKLLLQVQISIDGYVADNSGNTDWMVLNWGDDELHLLVHPTILGAGLSLFSAQQHPL